jgi:hypothetical protein
MTNKTITLLAISALAASLAAAQQPNTPDPAEYRHRMQQCSLAKKARDMPGVERAVLAALQAGPGDEYAWRTLAWAQARQGKWQESLKNAQENVRRHGVSGWSMAQLAESALDAGDYAQARNALHQADALPRATLNGSEGELQASRRRLLAATSQRTYSLEFLVDLKQKDQPQKPVWLLMPLMDTPLQSFTFEVSDVVSYRPRHSNGHEYIEVIARPGQPFTVAGRLTLKPFHLDAARLAAVPPSEVPQELKAYLGKFQNCSWWDPSLPEVRRIAETVKGRTDAQTVQNVLDWFRKNIRYGPIVDDPALGQLGTILKTRVGECHHMSGLFVTICRAAGVPACVAHGNPLPLNDKPFEQEHPEGHGWAEVYINTIGWVPVDQEDPRSLRTFTADRAWLAFGAFNRPPEDHYFARTIEYEGQEYPRATIQHAERIRGRLLEAKPVE